MDSPAARKLDTVTGLLLYSERGCNMTANYHIAVVGHTLYENFYTSATDITGIHGRIIGGYGDSATNNTRMLYRELVHVVFHHEYYCDLRRAIDVVRLALTFR